MKKVSDKKKEPLTDKEFGIVDASRLISDDKRTNLRFELVNEQLVMHLSLTFIRNDNVVIGRGQTDYPTPIGVFKIGDPNNFKKGEVVIPKFNLSTGTDPGEVRIFTTQGVTLETNGEKREHGITFVDNLEQLKEENRRLRELLSGLSSGK